MELETSTGGVAKTIAQAKGETYSHYRQWTKETSNSAPSQLHRRLEGALFLSLSLSMAAILGAISTSITITTITTFRPLKSFTPFWHCIFSLGTSAVSLHLPSIQLHFARHRSTFEHFNISLTFSLPVHLPINWTPLLVVACCVYGNLIYFAVTILKFVCFLIEKCWFATQMLKTKTNKK